MVDPSARGGRAHRSVVGTLPVDRLGLHRRGRHEGLQHLQVWRRPRRSVAAICCYDFAHATPILEDGIATGPQATALSVALCVGRFGHWTLEVA